MYLFPVIFVEAAKLESGVTINAPSTTETEKICDDTLDNDNDGKIDADDPDCGAAPANPATGICGLQIVSGVPIRYGILNPGQESQWQNVMVRNVGNVSGKLMVKGGDWIKSVAGYPTVSGPEITYVSFNPYGTWTALKSNEFQLTAVGAGHSQQLYYMLKVPPSGFSGPFRQELSIDLIC
jgi:hypothetical protein